MQLARVIEIRPHWISENAFDSIYTKMFKKSTSQPTLQGGAMSALSVYRGSFQLKYVLCTLTGVDFSFQTLSNREMFGQTYSNSPILQDTAWPS